MTDKSQSIQTSILKFGRKFFPRLRRGISDSHIADLEGCEHPRRGLLLGIRSHRSVIDQS